MTLSKGELRVQASLDHVADAMGGRDVFLDACRQSGSESGNVFLSFWHSLPVTERERSTLQDVCTRASLDATDLVGSMMGKLIMQANNITLLKSALRRPAVMDANLELAINGNPEIAIQAQKMQFTIGGLLKGEGTQVNVIQNVSAGTSMSFEEAAHQLAASVKADGKPVIVEPITELAYDVEGEFSSVQPTVDGTPTQGGPASSS